MFNSQLTKDRYAYSFIFLILGTLLLSTQMSMAGELQKLIDTAKSGEKVYIKEGVYEGSLIINKDLYLVGKSMNNVILKPTHSATEYAIEIKENINVTIEGITLRLTESLNGIRASKSTVKLLNCKISGGQKRGVLLTDCKTIIENCYVELSNESGLQAEYGSIMVKNSTFLKNKINGIFFNSHSNESNIPGPHLEYEISDSFVQGESIGVTIQGNCSGKLSGNQIIDNDNTGIYIVKGTGKHEIIQNKISQSNYGIYFELLENEKQQTSLIKKNVCSRLVRGICITGEAAIIDVIGNKCLDNDKEGIYVWSADEVKLSDNICNDNGEQGIFLERIKKRATVENNVCHSNKKNGIYLVSSKTILKKNKLNKNGFHGISVAYGIMEAEENECTGNDGSGVYLDSSIDGYIKNNILRNNRFYGIVRGENKIVSKIEDNEISGNLKGNIWQKEKEYGDFCLLLINKEYDKLDALGRELRTEEIKDLNGKWVIRNFYDEMSGGWNYISEEYSEKIIETMNEWIEEKPDSIIPRIVLSQLYVNVGWSHRGTEWGYKVEEENWKIFREYLEKAVEVIRKAEKLKEKDAHLYVVLIEAGLGLSNDRLINEGFEKGVAINKYYPPVYFNRATSLFPRWGGRKGELESFADDALKRTSDKYGSILYARIALYTHSYTYPKFDIFNFSYDKIKQGYEDILERYPDSKHYINAYCLFACLNNDLDKAEELFKRIGNDYSYVIWKDQNNLKKHYDWVHSEMMPGGG